MLLMFERGIRGGITQSVHRWTAEKKPYMGSEYDKSKPTKYLQYLNANNLYGWAMSQPLPTGGFHWVELRKDWSPKTIIGELAATKDHGYLFEVDVAYPRELHNYHNDLPFMCAKMKINGVEKLVPNLYYKKKYIIHINPIQAGLFWNHIGWGGHIVPPLCFSSICYPITTKLGMLVLWHKISQKQ